MPKFSDTEKTIIIDKLLAEGERLFIQHGLKKVTVDDLAQAANIAKGSFYAFFTNKEHLYAEILHNIQREMHQKTEAFYKSNKQLPPRELFVQVNLWAYSETAKYPILSQQSPTIVEYLFRKVPKDIMEQYFVLDNESVELMESYGIKFSVDIKTVTLLFQVLDSTIFGMKDFNDPHEAEAIRILLTGISTQIVKETNID